MPSIRDINSMTEDAFVAAFGSVFEHSPWIARRAWPGKPFADAADLHGKMCAVFRAASPEEQLGVIIAHPDLGERLAPLTAESVSEQAAAGLNVLTPDELEAFNRLNAAYKRKFSFPFIICARLNDKDKMLSAFSTRLENNRDEELLAALGQIELIARLRLQSLIP
ncbi:MAG TPA: 2-oxo-4-hydroxy-4-carboxy-5-ureidoimidazoline decarboxylase [Luteolibacter sp.]|nr:2-oxo-4-hydroxy-4-carboxy-5-ureidoimidazoline decarboxylase [Luteolibacter sp.]